MEFDQQVVVDLLGNEWFWLIGLEVCIYPPYCLDIEQSQIISGAINCEMYEIKCNIVSLIRMEGNY